jgi:hypothetical protein
VLLEETGVFCAGVLPDDVGVLPVGVLLTLPCVVAVGVT